MINKSPESKAFLKKDRCFINECVKTDIDCDESGLEGQSNMVLDSSDVSVFKKMKLRDYLKLDNLIISLDTGWKTVFDTTVLVVIGYSCLTTVFQVAYRYEPPHGSWMKIFDWMVIFCFSIDFIFKFVEEYEDPETF